MDRGIIYPGQVPLETDLLFAQKSTMVGLAKLAAAMLGTSTFANGLSVVPNSPAALNVLINPGEIYSLVNLDGSAYSSISADTTHQIVKQGISLDQVTLGCAAPGTVGFSINYLIEASYLDTDGTPVVLPYYNASNPSTAYSGPANAGTTQNTRRLGQVSLVAKAGVAATTGTQTTPAADAGYVGLYVVTVAYGQTQITVGNIAAVAGAPVLPSAGIVAGGFQGNYFNIASAAGTADAITASYTPGISALSNGMTLYLRAALANATTTPTFTPNSGVITAKNIVKGAGSALAVGDIAGAGHWVELQYDLTLDKWVLLNPATGVSVASGLAALTVQIFTTTGTLPGSVVAGTAVINSASATTQTLMAASSVQAGKRIEFLNINTGVGTVSRAGADTISVNNSTVTSLALGNGETLTLESNGTNGWYAVSGSAQLAYAATPVTAKAWVNFNGVTTATIRASYNVSSVTRNGTGDYTVNFSSALADANYSAVVGFTPDMMFSGTPAARVTFIQTQLAASARVICGFQAGTGGVGYIDFPLVDVGVFR